MARYDDYDVRPNGTRQKDLVLNMNEFAHLLSRTDGNIKCAVGPFQTSLSQQETPVIFNTKTKRFEECDDYEKAKQLFISAPEGWYIVLKNPAKENMHPEAGRQNQTPTTIEIGRKINIFGPTSFALFPGQMAKVVRGHRLRSNQYLLARVYDAAAAKANAKAAAMVDTEGNDINSKTEYFAGQLLVIKGTEVSFYMPPTGIEVIPIGGQGDNYVRDAVTLERLEYAILKDEDGEKRYIHGPAVVFPKPTETFVQAPNGGNIFRALELSPISGIYVKVIAAYKDETGTEHPIGEELFITGNDQMIYYPRPEHALIQYDGKYMHHAIAIPEGEGRYILNRLTGTIKTVKGPSMYLPDPRVEVVVKRKLSRKECELYYPGNAEVIAYNQGLTERSVAKKAAATRDSINSVYSTDNQESALAIFEVNANISRGTSYTKPRTITLDTKYEGAVAIEVWNGYAINIIAKNGTSRLVVGPATTLLDYDETLETVNPNTENETVFLKVAGNVFKTSVPSRTKDNVQCFLDTETRFSFILDEKDKWFQNKDYINLLNDFVAQKVREQITTHTAKELYDNTPAIVREAFNDSIFGYIRIDEVRSTGFSLDSTIAKALQARRDAIIEDNIAAVRQEEEIELKKRIVAAETKQEEDAIAANQRIIELKHTQALDELAKKEAIAEVKRAQYESEKQAQADLQKVIDLINAADLERKRKSAELEQEIAQKRADLEKAKQEAYAATVERIFGAITPDLTAAMNNKANAELTAVIAESMSPYAIASVGESVSDVTRKLLRGTTLEEVVGNLPQIVNK